MKAIIRFALLAAVLAPLNQSASASQTFNLSGVTLQKQGTQDFAGTLTGSFTTNDSLKMLESANIVASASPGGQSPLGFTYTFGTMGNSTAVASLPSQYFQLSSGSDILRFYFKGGLTSTGAQIQTGGSSYESEIGVHRIVAGGSVVAAPIGPAVSAAPEPSTLVIAAGAIPALFTLSYRRRRRRLAA